MRYDSFLLLSFGGPEGPDDVLPFLRNVTRGRNVPDERLAEVAEQYALFGGRSPINDHCRDLLAALAADFDAHGLDLPLYWGNRNWHPYLADTVATMAEDGCRNTLVLATSAFGSYSGCRQYREDLAGATEAAAPDAPALTKLRLFYNHPGFVEAQADRLATALAESSVEATPRIVFTAHSIPVSMAAGCNYVDQLHEAAGLVLGAAGLDPATYDLVYQSRSGPPAIPWLEPDINDHLELLAAGGEASVAVVPLGFVSDHMEVLFDLDTQARATADRLGMTMIRVPTVGTHPRFVTMVRELIEERSNDGPLLHLGTTGPWPHDCPPDHCPAPARPRRP